jgi:hypothetical protein
MSFGCRKNQSCECAEAIVAKRLKNMKYAQHHEPLAVWRKPKLPKRFGDVLRAG